MTIQKKIKRLAEIRELCEREDRDPNPDEITEANRLMDEIDIEESRNFIKTEEIPYKTPIDSKKDNQWLNGGMYSSLPEARGYELRLSAVQQ